MAVLGIISIELLRRRSERVSQEALKAVADQAAARIAGFLSHQDQLIRTLAATVRGPQDAPRVAESVIEAPSLGRIELIGPDHLPTHMLNLSNAELARTIHGEEVKSDVYVSTDLTPAMDCCFPTKTYPNHALCAQLDLLELWRFVQSIRVGTSGYALAFGKNGQLLASGLGVLRAAILTGDQVLEAGFAREAVSDVAKAPTRYMGPLKEPVIAGWARIPGHDWSVVVEQPISEALHTARVGQWILVLVLVFALLLSVTIGAIQSQRVLRELEAEERWRTAGRIAAGITHDLGHRLRLLQQTAALADAERPEFLPRIRANLRSEVAVLEKFISDFADLSRDVKTLEPLPLDLVMFLDSIGRIAAAQAEVVGVGVQVETVDEHVWVSVDRHLLERAVLNLVSNAIEASPRGSVVTLTASIRGTSCVIEVRDRGTGIPPDRLSTLFDAFASTKKTGAHIGMGLPNVKRIAEAHSGDVTVQSEVGKGTAFFLWLPCAAPPTMSTTTQRPTLHN
jgi:signal transduction histidine kinase